MVFTKITEEDIKNKGVVGLPDTPNLSTSDMQSKFDEIAKDVIVPKFNELSEELDNANIGNKIESNDITNMKLDADGKLLVSKDGGNHYVGTGSSGHIIEDGSGTSYPARSRLQFSDNVNVMDDEEGNKTFISIPSGEKGEQGESATIHIGEVESGDEASVENVGSKNDAILNFILPKGESGDAATIQVGTVRSGDNASVSNRGTSSKAILDFVIPKGEKGDDGTSFTILDAYETYEEFIRVHPTGSRGQAYLVGTTDENTVYVWSASNNSWFNAGPLKGNKGDTGKAGTITVGTVTTTDIPSVENVGTSEEAILNFGIPKGEKGNPGNAATIAVGNVVSGDSPSVTNSGTPTNAVFNFILPKGEKGEQGTPTTVNGKNGSNITLTGSDIKLDGYEKATEELSINSEDSVEQAISKLEYKADNANVDTLTTMEQVRAATDNSIPVGAGALKEIDESLTCIKLTSNTINIDSVSTAGITFNIPEDKELLGIVGFNGGNSQIAVSGIIPSDDRKTIAMFLKNTYSSKFDITPYIHVLVK